jgi:hypothetical protein
MTEAGSPRCREEGTGFGVPPIRVTEAVGRVETVIRRLND